MSLHRGKNHLNPTYRYGDHIIETASAQRDLGVLIDSKLTFMNHIEMIVAKANSALGFVKRFCYDIDDKATLKAVYSAFVQSSLDY